MWRLTYKWAQFTHANKPTSWIIPRYFGQFNKTRQDRWVFGDRTTGAYMHKFAWTTIVRHAMVKSGASPDDPALTAYWAQRRRKPPPLSIDKANLRLFESQHGRCCICGDGRCPSTNSHKARASGSTGCSPPAERSPRSRRGSTAQRTRPNLVSDTPAATIGNLPTVARTTSARPRASGLA